MVPPVIVAAFVTWILVDRESTVPPVPEKVETVNPDLTAVEIGFLNPEHENLTIVPAAKSLVGNAPETVRISVVAENEHEMVDSKFCSAAQR